MRRVKPKRNVCFALGALSRFRVLSGGGLYIFAPYTECWMLVGVARRSFAVKSLFKYLNKAASHQPSDASDGRGICILYIEFDRVATVKAKNSTRSGLQRKITIFQRRVLNTTRLTNSFYRLRPYNDPSE